ncbi:hypothetical protein C8R44DRAFT_744751 [Mycena epipterygia]|nr:hypothetical protein C8R44DRAFT_744751 [Mycena epipterygia]
MSTHPPRNLALNKPRRNRVASSKLSDTTNGEASSAVHQNVLATTPILGLIKKTRKLSALLPEIVREATDADDVYRVITKVHGIDDTIAGTFNRRFDILFGEDCRDADGRLKNIARGDFGMNCVIEYLESIHWESAGIPLDLAGNKLTRVVVELEHLCASKAKRAAGPRTSKPIEKENGPPEAEAEDNDAQNAKGNTEWDHMMDAVFDAAITGKNGKPDKDFRPKRKNPELSEEEEDDFDIIELDKPATPEGSRRRKLLVVDDGTGNSVDQLALRRYPCIPATARPTKKAKQTAASASIPKSKKTAASASAPKDKTKKRGPKNTSRDHWHPPRAVKYDGQFYK